MPSNQAKVAFLSRYENNFCFLVDQFDPVFGLGVPIPIMISLKIFRDFPTLFNDIEDFLGYTLKISPKYFGIREKSEKKNRLMIRTCSVYLVWLFHDSINTSRLVYFFLPFIFFPSFAHCMYVCRRGDGVPNSFFLLFKLKKNKSDWMNWNKQFTNSHLII